MKPSSNPNRGLTQTRGLVTACHGTVPLQPVRHGRWEITMRCPGFHCRFEECFYGRITFGRNEQCISYFAYMCTRISDPNKSENWIANIVCPYFFDNDFISNTFDRNHVQCYYLFKKKLFINKHIVYQNIFQRIK